MNHHTHEGKHRLNLNRTKRKIVLITMKKSECDKSPSNVHIINTCLQGINSIFIPSGIVILMMTMNGHVAHIEKAKLIQWSRLIIEICKYCKNNILDSKMVSHHESHGRIYAFGHQGVFKKVNNSTVGLYSIKKRYKNDGQLEVEKMAEQIEDMINVEIDIAKKTLSKIVKQV